MGRLAAALGVAGIAGLAPAGALAPTPVQKSPYEIKADFLRICTRYVEWPPRAFPDAGGPFVIGVFGKDPFGGTLEKAFPNKSVGGRRIVFRRFRRIEEMSPCHLLFVSSSENDRLGAIFERLGRACTLTVGETGIFLRRGGMINLLIENERLRFEVDREAAERAGLKISSDMLDRAKPVRRGG